MNDKIDLSGYKKSGKLTTEQIFGEERKVAKRRYSFFDKDGKIVDKDDDRAVKAIIVEEDELGRMINEIFGEIRKPNEENVKSR